MNIFLGSSEETGRQHGTICQRHTGASFRVLERRLQEGSATGEGLEDVHHRGHRPHGLLHPERGAFFGYKSYLYQPMY